MKKLTSFIIFMVFALSVAGFPEESRSEYTGHGPEVAKIKGRMKYLDTQIIVKFKGDVEPFRVIEVPREKVFEKIGEYLKKPDVVYAEPNYLAYALMVPNDPYYRYQWHLDNPVYGGIQMEQAWDLSTGAGVTVAVIDTGIRKGTDLANTCFVPGWDYVNNDSDPADDNGHGTHVAGTIAQSTNNGVGVAGVAFKSCLMPMKVLDATGTGTYSNVASGIRYAADNGAEVINLSLGGSSPSPTLEGALAYAYAKGVTIVAAAGNDSSSTLSYPAAYDDYVIAVGATRYDETKASYSNYGPSLDLVAPGGDTSVDQNGDGYGDGVLQQTFRKTFLGYSWAYYFFQGTSMAAPHVSGVAALLISHGNATTPEEVRAALQQTAECLPPGETCPNNTYSYGLVDAYAALQWTSIPDTTPPVISGVTTTNITSISATITWLTDELSNSVVNYGTTIDLGSTVSDAAMVTSHSVNLTGLAKTTTYYYEVQSTDASGNTASDNSGGAYYTFTTLHNQSPVANAGPDQTVYVGDTVNFDGSASYDPDGSIVNYVWDFEDGTPTATGVTTKHTYSTVGTYTVTLKVTDNDGATSTDSAKVTVQEKPTEVIVFSDSFEGGLGKWTQDAQNDWFISTQRAVNGSYSAEVDGLASDAKLTSIPINLQGKTNARITFSWYIESGLDLGEYLAFDVSTDGGINWVEKARLRGNVDPENTWHNVNINLTYISQLKIQFRGKMSLSTEDANVDNVVVTAQ